MFNGGYCNFRINITLIWPILPFATSYGTKSPECEQKEVPFFPHDETSLGITHNSYQQLERKTWVSMDGASNPAASHGGSSPSYPHIPTLKVQQINPIFLFGLGRTQDSVDIISKKLLLWFPFQCVEILPSPSSHGRPPRGRMEARCSGLCCRVCMYKARVSHPKYNEGLRR